MPGAGYPDMRRIVACAAAADAACGSSTDRMMTAGADEARSGFEDHATASRAGGIAILARPERLELPTPRFVVWCSIQLSYGRAVPPSKRARN